MADPTPIAGGPVFEPWLEAETLVVERAGGAVRIALHRPERLNAFTPQLGDELTATLVACEAPEVRAVMLTGSGRAFSSGADLVTGTGLTASQALEWHYHPALRAIRALEKPVIAAVNGPAAGIGCSVALCCDLAIMSRSAYLLLAFVNVGLVPDGGVSLLVARKAGGGRAAEMGMLGERVDAETAERWGLVARVADADAFRAEAGAFLGRLAEGPTRAYAAAKVQQNATVFAGYDEQLAAEGALADGLFSGEDVAEGIAAFRERRPARFVGR